MIYHLEVELYTTQFGKLQERDSHYSNVYSGFNKAKQCGIKWLEYRFEQLKSEYKCLENYTIEELEKNKKIVYLFTITKITDLKYVETFRLPEHNYECRRLRPTHIVYRLKYNGEEIYHTLEYRIQLKDSGYVFTRYPRRPITFCRFRI